MTWDTSPIPGGWEFTETDSKARIIIDYIAPTSRGLEAWVELHTLDYPIPVAEGTQNLMGARSTRPFIEEARLLDKAVPWEAGLREAFHFVIEAHRDSAATVDLTLIEPQPLQWLVKPLIEQGGNTRLIAPGGSGKSIFAMALALTVATGRREFVGLDADVTGPVLYLDWETNAGTHARRVHALCEPVGLALPDPGQIVYQYHASPLNRTVQAVRRMVDKEGAILLVVDSAKMAAGPSSQSSGEDSTLGLYTALREIGRPALIVDHKTKEDIAKKRQGGYGSIYNENLARLQWEFTSYSQLSPGERTWTLTLTKENNVGSLPPIGFKMVTGGGEEGITSAQFFRVHANTVRDPNVDDLADRIESLMVTSHEPLSVSTICDLSQATSGSVRSALNRDERFENVNQGKAAKLGLWRLTDDYRTEAGLQEPLAPVEMEDEQVEVAGWDTEVIY